MAISRVPRPLTDAQRAVLVRRMRSQLITDWVQTQLAVLPPYRSAALVNWQLTGLLGYDRQLAANVERFLSWCAIPNASHLGLARG